MNIKIMNTLIKESPQVYSRLRLLKELDNNSFTEIETSLEFEINLYEEVPHLIERNYETIDHFLDYFLEVKNYRQILDETGNRPKDF